MNKEQRAREVIKSNLYLSLSTCDGKTPWIAPVQYVVNNKYVFYFVSAIDSLHGQHILKNPNVAFTIFDSHQPSGTGVGIQVFGKSGVVEKADYPEVIIRYLDELKSTTIDMSKYAVFKIEPAKFFITDPEAWEKEGVDKSVEVKVK